MLWFYHFGTPKIRLDTSLICSIICIIKSSWKDHLRFRVTALQNYHYNEIRTRCSRMIESSYGLFLTILRVTQILTVQFEVSPRKGSRHKATRGRVRIRVLRNDFVNEFGLSHATTKVFMVNKRNSRCNFFWEHYLQGVPYH